VTGVLVLVDHDRGRVGETTLEALTAARDLPDATVEAVVCGSGGEEQAGRLAAHGAVAVHVLEHPMLDDYAPEAWGEAVRQLVEAVSPSALLAPGSDRGNEVLAHVAARLDLPMAANATQLDTSDGLDGGWTLTRTRWGGSLLEEAAISAPTKLVSIAPHAVEAVGADGPTADIHRFSPDLDERLARTRVVERTSRGEGVTLQSAPIVISGGRGVGSEDGFARLEELAELLGGAVGCSRVATNAGWRPHADQVGQTGAQVAPTLYIACGISGAIQHWVGCMNSKHILAINTDEEAPMVTRAEYAVLGDLHEVLPAIAEEVRRRSG
jgi:electron transfer flavoprotein alpha subunit